VAGMKQPNDHAEPTKVERLKMKTNIVNYNCTMRLVKVKSLPYSITDIGWKSVVLMRDRH